MRARTMGMALLGLLAATTCRAAIERDEFRWRVPLRETLASGMLYRVRITPEVYDGSQAFPADLRLLDEAGRDWLFFPHPAGSDDPLEHLPLTALANASGDPAPGGVQRFVFDAGHQNTPLRRIALFAAEPAYAIPVKVYGRHRATNEWRWIADGGLHRTNGHERAWVDLHNNAYRFLRVDVLHHDAPPLTFTNIHALLEPHYLVIQPATNGRAWLYFGAKEYALPRFELQHRTPRHALAAAQPAEFGPRERNPHRLGRDIWQYGRLLFAATLALAGTLALGWLLKRLRGG